MMRSLGTIVAATLLVAPGSSAKIPDPSTSGIAVSGNGAACQYRFRADGGLDCMTVCVTLRDAFGLPVTDCSTSVQLEVSSETLALCSCGPVAATGLTDAGGAFRAEFDALGGRGGLEVVVSHHCFVTMEIARIPVEFTSPDLVGSCEPVDILSLGIWANCLPPAPHCRASDYNCDATVDILDLAVWAGALGIGCNSP